MASFPDSIFSLKYLENSPYFKTAPTGMLLRYLNDNPGNGAHALDIGCGNGRNLRAMIEAGYQATGIDLSDEAVSLSQQTITKAAVTKASATSLPFADGYFSLVFCGTTLSCLDPTLVPVALSEIHRVLLPNGPFLFTDFSTRDPGATRCQDETASECAVAIRCYFELDSVREMLSSFVIQDMWEVDKTDRSHGPAHSHNLIRFIARKR